MKKILITILLSAFAFGAFAGTFTITPKEQQQITEEAEDWIDDMPEGLQDRLSDAVLHAMRGFSSEINSFRNYKDNSAPGQYAVTVSDIKGGKDSSIGMRIYSGKKSDKSAKCPVLVYFHGGGWTMGSLNATDRFCRALASEGKVLVISVDYPLAPEYPYPSAINVGKNAVEFIYSKAAAWGGDNNRISLGGDGAGGNIALAVYESLNPNMKIKSLVLYYPLLKTSGSLTDNLKRKYGRGYGFDSRLWEVYTTAYQGKDIVYKKTLPATLMLIPGRDIIYDVFIDFKSSHKSVECVEFSGALHGFISDGHQTTAFDKAVEITNAFLTK